jgi:hypothetical protein
VLDQISLGMGDIDAAKFTHAQRKGFRTDLARQHAELADQIFKGERSPRDSEDEEPESQP